MYEAFDDRLIIQPEKQEHSDLLMIDDDKIYTNQGVVKSIGDKVTMVKVGDKVIFHCFDELPLPTDDLVVVREKSLLAKYSK